MVTPEKTSKSQRDRGYTTEATPRRKLKMSKLTEWLMFTSVPLGIWLAVITGCINLSYATEWQEVLLFLPLIALLVFGLYAASVVLYRTLTFNDCDKEATELQKEIKEAKRDLRVKGILS